MELFDIIELESYITPLAERHNESQISRSTLSFLSDRLNAH